MGWGGRRPGAGRPRQSAAAREALLRELVAVLQVCGLSPAEIAAAAGIEGVPPVPAAWRARHVVLGIVARRAEADRALLAGVLKAAAAALEQRVALVPGLSQADLGDDGERSMPLLSDGSP